MVSEIIKNRRNFIMEETSLTKEQLLMKSDGVKDCVKWIEKKLKDEKEQLKYVEFLWYV